MKESEEIIKLCNKCGGAGKVKTPIQIPCSPEFHKGKDCGLCYGTGFMWDTRMETCDTCGGKGRL